MQAFNRAAQSAEQERREKAILERQMQMQGLQQAQQMRMEMMREAFKERLEQEKEQREQGQMTGAVGALQGVLAPQPFPQSPALGLGDIPSPPPSSFEDVQQILAPEHLSTIMKSEGLRKLMPPTKMSIAKEQREKAEFTNKRIGEQALTYSLNRFAHIKGDKEIEELTNSFIESGTGVSPEVAGHFEKTVEAYEKLDKETWQRALAQGKAQALGLDEKEIERIRNMEDLDKTVKIDEIIGAREEAKRLNMPAKGITSYQDLFGLITAKKDADIEEWFKKTKSSLVPESPLASLKDLPDDTPAIVIRETIRDIGAERRALRTALLGEEITKRREAREPGRLEQTEPVRAKAGAIRELKNDIDRMEKEARELQAGIDAFAKSTKPVVRDLVEARKRHLGEVQNKIKEKQDQLRALEGATPQPTKKELVPKPKEQPKSSGKESLQDVWNELK